MWQKVAGIFTSGRKHQISNCYGVCWIQWNREASCKINGTLSFWGLYMIYISFHQIILFGVLANYVCNDVTVRTEIYMCMHLYTYVYSACNREVVGASAISDELFSRKHWLFQENLQQLKIGAACRAWLALRLSIARNKYVYMCIYAFQFF